MKFRQIQPDKIETELIQALQQVCGQPDSRELSNTQWTRKVKSEIARLGKSLSYNVYAHSVENADDGEWLFDVCWLEYDQSLLKSAVLVVESEWNPHGADDDFQKLVVARARYRMMIFEVTQQESRDSGFARLIKHAERYEFSTPSDRYLMCCWKNQEWNFDCRVYGILD